MAGDGRTRALASLRGGGWLGVRDNPDHRARLMAACSQLLTHDIRQTQGCILHEDNARQPVFDGVLVDSTYLSSADGSVRLGKRRHGACANRSREHRQARQALGRARQASAHATFFASLRRHGAFCTLNTYMRHTTTRAS